MNLTEYKLPTVKELREQTENGNHKFEFVSTFAGGGGSSTGYRMAGGKALLVNEFIPEAVNTYKANWPTTKIIPDDIREITPEQILEDIGKQKYELDLLDGSPPCSAFSTQGAGAKNWGKTKSYSDTKQKNVEDLFFDYLRILEGIMPKAFVAENVAGLATGKAKGYLNMILRSMREIGYQVVCKKINAKHLGVPQSRTRLIFIGIRNDLADKTKPIKIEPHDRIVTLKEAFQGLEFTEQDRLDTNIEKYAIYKKLITLREGEQHKKSFSLSKADPNGISACLTATTANIGAAAPCHWDNRVFTINELKRIMSVPDDYILTGNHAKKAERIGRMVAPLMMKAVATAIINTGVFDV